MWNRGTLDTLPVLGFSSVVLYDEPHYDRPVVSHDEQGQPLIIWVGLWGFPDEGGTENLGGTGGGSVLVAAPKRTVLAACKSTARSDDFSETSLF